MSAQQTNVSEAGTGSYSDNTNHTLYAFSVPENVVGLLNISVCARRVSDGAGKTFVFAVNCKRNSGDASVEVGSSLPFSTLGDALAMLGVSAMVDTDGEDLIVVVNGLASTLIDWSCLNNGFLTGHA